MRKMLTALAAWMLMALLMTGCGQNRGPKEIVQSSLSVSGKGEVTLWLMEAFDREYYDLAELETMIREEVSQFNEAHGEEGREAVKLRSLEQTEDGSQVIACLVFAGVQEYQEYSGQKLFYGTVNQAGTSGYHIEGNLFSVKENAVVESSTVEELGGRHVLITDEKLLVYSPGKVQYVSEGASLSEDGSVIPAEDEAYTYILMK